jgi:hypothetical protein
MGRITRFLFLIVLIAVPANAQRLPGNVIPEHYTLWFAPDLDKETFRGRESIDVVLTEPSTTVTLHAAEINFSEVTITSGGKTQTARVTLDESRETATFTVPQLIAEGKATIQITYTGILNDKLRGFYISKANGRKYAVSQMEATDARRAFPPRDPEPAEPAHSVPEAIHRAPARPDCDRRLAPRQVSRAGVVVRRDADHASRYVGVVSRGEDRRPLA